MKFTFADFCSGIGGFRIALEKFEGKCVFTSEIDADCIKTYNANYSDDVAASDLLGIIPKTLPDFEVLCAGFPCQPFSIAGKRQGGMDDRAAILPKLLEIVQEKQPKIVFLENVPHFLRLNKGEEFARTKKRLHELGYSVFHEILDSVYFGVPQSRPRLFIVAVHNRKLDSGFKFPVGSNKPTPFRPFINHGDYSIPITKKWEEYLDYYSGQKTLTDLSFTPPKTRIQLERMDKDINLRDCIYQMRSSGIRAISLDRPLPTLAVSVSGGGAMIPVFSGERRHLNLIELKRLMGYPDQFNFPVSRTAAIKQLANSVCPPVIEAIGSEIVKTLMGLSDSCDQRYLPL